MRKNPSMTKYIASALLFALSACSSPDKGEDKKNEAVPPAEVDTRNQPQSAKKTVTTSLMLQLTLTKEGDQTLYLADVAPTLGKCLQCHGNGGTQPNLQTTPYAASTLKQMLARVNDAARPMPPQGLLPSAERQTLSQWIESGAQLTSQEAATDLAAYSLELTWTKDGETATTVHFSGSSTGMFDLDLGALPVGQLIQVRAKITGPEGKVVFNQALAA